MYDRIAILNLLREGPGSTVFYIEGLYEKIKDLSEEVRKLKEENERLRNILSTDSSNSSKSPSSDMIRKVVIKNNRKQSGKKRGGQKGHKGTTLELSEKPDTIIRHKVSKCKHCGKSLKRTKPKKLERRQIYDIPEPRIQVEEHISEVKECPCCGKISKGEFPKSVSNIVQYGKNIQGIIIYLTNEQTLPYKRTADAIRTIYSHEISEGTIDNMISRYSKLLEKPVSMIKESMKTLSLLHADETGMYIDKRLCWLNVTSGKELTYYECHEKRGKEAMDSIGILPEFKGTLVHDGFKSYWQYNNFTHSLCNAHHLRELKYVYEEEGQSWASNMIELFLEIKDEVEESKERLKNSLEEDKIFKYDLRYNQLLRKGYRQLKYSKQKYKIKKNKSRNLLERFKKYKKETLRFMYDFNVPFDNNLAERDIRMMKLKQKISGCFRSINGGIYFCRIKSYISSVKKQKLNVMESIKSIYEGICPLRYH
jgi:transposase/regulator of replication initiation timing